MRFGGSHSFQGRYSGGLQTFDFKAAYRTAYLHFQLVNCCQTFQLSRARKPSSKTCLTFG